MEYVFRTTQYDVAELVPEVSKALQKRAEMYSRQTVPGLWKVTDRLPKGGAPKEMSKGRKIYRRILGVILILLGLFLLIPGLTAPKELLVPLIFGILGVIIGIFAIKNTGKKQSDRKGRHEKEAYRFLSNIAASEQEEVRFNESGIAFGKKDTVSYESVEYFIETPSGYLVAWGTQGTFLQKKDLQDRDLQEFSAFVNERRKMVLE